VQDGRVRTQRALYFLGGPSWRERHIPSAAACAMGFAATSPNERDGEVFVSSGLIMTSGRTRAGRRSIWFTSTWASAHVAT